MKPRIFYHCYSHQRPTGGQKHTYRHVDILNQSGHDAYVSHEEENFRLTWFENDTRVIGPREFGTLYDPSRDYVVVPEDLGQRVDAFGGRIVVFNKNVFHGFRAQGARGEGQCLYELPAVAAVMAVSQHNVDLLRYAYPHQPVHHVRSEINLDVFQHRPLSQKKLLIASSAKQPDYLAALYHMVRARCQAKGRPFEWTVLSRHSEAETAACLQDALVFVHLSGVEGLPRLPREAMACGCVVAACDSGPLRECIPARSLFPHGDLVSMARFIETVLDSHPQSLTQWGSLVDEGRAVAGRYSRARQEESVLSAWTAILTCDQRSTGQTVGSVPESA